jgi:cobalamin-dependent methionine synthase I
VLRTYIDWTPFFQSWEMRGKYPAIFDDPTYGVEARKIFDDANAILDRIIADRRLRARAVAGLFPAVSTGDDIIVQTPHGPATLSMLRQQSKRAPGVPHRSLADYIARQGAGIDDWMGAFVVTAGDGVEQLCAEYEAAHDDYSSIMVKAIADRLAEACAEWLHERVRTELWGYASNEALNNDALIRESYQACAGLSGMSGPHGQACVVRDARCHDAHRCDPDGESGHGPCGQCEWMVLRTSGSDVLRRRNHRTRSAGGLCTAMRHDRRGV